MRVIEQILELARWAPSGDNTQPWRFEIKGEHEVVVHGFDTRAHCVYDLDGRPSQIALGALLENIRLSASGHRLRAEVSRRLDRPDEKPTFEIRFAPDPALAPSPLIPFITTRAVQRRVLSTRALTAEQKSRLEASVGPGYQVSWFETPRRRWRVAMLMFRNAKLRLTMREAFEVHRNVIEWDAQFSEDKIPDQAIGVDPLTRRLMRWVMQSWPRADFLNTWLAGTLAPRLQLDLIPGLACAAHLAIGANAAPASIDDYVAAGRAMQRLWLEAARLGLWLQPEMTPLIFRRYHREGIAFTSSAPARAMAAEVASDLEALTGPDRAQRLVFFARVGTGRAPRARSTRIPLSRLAWTPKDD
jgi:nitroreductase